MALDSHPDLGLCHDLAAALQRVVALNQEVDRLTREVEGYQTVARQAVHYIRDLSARLRRKDDPA